MNGLTPAKTGYSVLLGIVALGIGLGFCLDSAVAESMYHVRPKLTPRDRDTAPTISPLLNLSEQQQKRSRSQASESEPTPAVSTDFQPDPSYEQPVSYSETQVDTTSELDADKPDKRKNREAKNKAKKVKHPLEAKPTTASQPDGQTPKGSHPVVISPEPLLPEPQSASHTQATDEALLDTETENFSNTDYNESFSEDISTQQPVQGQAEMTVIDSNQTIEAKSDNSSASQKSKATSTQPGKPKSTASSKTAQASTTSSQARNSKQKAVVHFPQDLTPQSRPAHSQDRHIYPVGYRPYVPPVSPEKRDQLRVALNHYNRATYYGERNKIAEAIAEYTQAINKHPMFADAYVGLSSISIPKHDWENVIEHAKKALSLKDGFMEPSNINLAYFNLGVAYCVANDSDMAKQYFKHLQKEHYPASKQLELFMKQNCTPQ